MTTTYVPNRWLLCRITNKEGAVHYRVFGTWSGGYLDGASWKFSSGCVPGAIPRSTVDGCIWTLPQSSGSEYVLHPHSEGIAGGWAGVLETYTERMKEAGGSIVVVDNPDFGALNKEFK